MQEEVHIAGVIVHALPAQVPQVRAQVQAIPHARVHAAGADGRMVVTLETNSTPRTLDCMDAIRAWPGVLNVALVYQHAEPLAAMDEEIE